MDAQKKPTRDWLYLAVLAVQLFGILALDLVAFYPPSLYQPPSSPLHFLLTLRRAYVSYTADPFFAPSTPQPPWLRVFLALEGLVQLPLIIYLVRHLSRPRPTSGPVELAGLVLGCVNFMGAAACCSELWCMGEDLVTAEKKAQLLYGTYLPFAIVPAVMARDMFLRLLPRVRDGEEEGTKKETR